MPDTSESAQKLQFSEKANGFEQKSGESTEGLVGETKTGAAESARTAALKARKRTKTGCLSRPPCTVAWDGLALIKRSMSKTTDQMWRGASDLQELRQI